VGVGVGVEVAVAVAVAVEGAVAVGVKVGVAGASGVAVDVGESEAPAIRSSGAERQPAMTIKKTRAIMSRCMKEYVNRTVHPRARNNHNPFIFPIQSPGRLTTRP
jgi:UDP-3-O-[3-hydroxymyristoyl] glucosamine N-acyltransferase